jgi:hypothetical protein
MQKDHPEKLGEKVSQLVKKIKFIRQYKEQELKEKRLKEMAKQEILQMERQGSANGIQQLQDEINHYKERYHSEKHSAEMRRRELEAMENKGDTLKRTLQHDEAKLLQMQVLIEKEKEKMQGHIQNRYW